MRLSCLLIRHKSQICLVFFFLVFLAEGQKQRERETVDILIKVPTAFICGFRRDISHRMSDVKTGEVLVPSRSCQTSIPPRLHTSYSPGSGQGLMNYAAAPK